MNQLARAATALAASGILLATTACGTSSTGAGAGSEGDRLKVVTAFYPLQYVAEQVAGDRAEITTLTAPGSEPHDLELTAKQVASLSSADVVIYQKGFQASVDKAVEQAQPKNVVDVSTVVSLAASSEAGEHTDEHEHEGESAEEHAGHDHGGTDPHVWLDPQNMVKISQSVSSRLSEVDAEHAATFKTQSEGLTAQLTQLDKSFEDGLKTCQRKEFITSHAAFGYLAKAYGLTQIGISGLAAESDPSPARIAEVQKLAKEHGVTTIFYETLVSPAHAKAIAGDLKLKTDVLDPLEGITDQSKGDDYISVQRANLTALQTANGCK